jgi:hypothetical protein
MSLEPLPPTYGTTRDAVHAVACYVLGPARKAAVGRIGLTPTSGGLGTPPFGPADRVLRIDATDVGADLVVDEGGREEARAALTTVRATAEIAGVALSADPGVGRDLPPFAPDEPLVVDPEAARALAAWYAFGAEVLDRLRTALAGTGTTSERQMWPEHFDLALDHTFDGGVRANVGCSPGDSFDADPYVYVGPWDRAELTGDDWNAPFGAYLPYAELLAADDPVAAALTFVEDRLHRLRLT